MVAAFFPAISAFWSQKGPQGLLNLYDLETAQTRHFVVQTGPFQLSEVFPTASNTSAVLMAIRLAYLLAGYYGYLLWSALELFS